MKKRYGMAAVLVLAAGAAFAAPMCKPVVGHFEAHVVPPGRATSGDYFGSLCTE